MDCWEEIRIGRAAIRLVDVDERGAEAPADLAGFLKHAESCARCGRILRRLRETERRFRALRALRSATEKESAGGGRVFALVDVERSGPAPVDPRERPGLECFSYAAAVASPRPRRKGPRIRHLRTEDGRFEVRVIENESGRGATAVLVSPPGEMARAGSGAWSLRTGKGSFAFREGGAAVLPSFPAEPVIDLVYAPESETS